MQFSQFSIVAALVAAANAAVTLTNSNYNVAAGTPFLITWTGATGPVTLFLVTGDSNNLKTVMTLDSGVTADSFSWTPSVSTVDGMYAIEVNDSVGPPNYSPMFSFTGGMAGPSSSSGSITDSSSTATSSSASKTSLEASTTSSAAASSTSSAAASSTTDSSSSESITSVSKTKTASSTITSASNSTQAIVTVTSTLSQSSTTSAQTTASTSAPNSNSGASGLASPLAFVCLAVAALITLN